MEYWLPDISVDGGLGFQEFWERYWWVVLGILGLTIVYALFRGIRDGWKPMDLIKSFLRMIFRSW